MKTGGRRAAERWRRRKRAAGSSSLTEERKLAFLDRKMATATEMARRRQVRAKMRHSTATWLLTVVFVVVDSL